MPLTLPCLKGQCGWNLSAHDMNTPYKDEKGPCTELAAGEERNTVGNATERPT